MVVPEKGLYQALLMADGGAVSGTASEYIRDATEGKHENEPFARFVDFKWTEAG